MYPKHLLFNVRSKGIIAMVQEILTASGPQGLNVPSLPSGNPNLM